MRLVFVHGWALAPEIWDLLAPKLPFPQTRVNLGFFGPPASLEVFPGDILVGHSAGLLWGLIQGTPAFAFQIKVFFLLCVIVAGVYGAATVSRRILYVQAAPAALALILLWLA